MTGVVKISPSELITVRAACEAVPSDEDQDEMAIPSYLHASAFIRWIVWRRHELIAELGDFRRGMNVLDFGCGPGIFLPTLCSKVERVHAIDLFPEIAMELARQRDLAVEFHDTIDDIEDESLDVIVAAEVLEHIDMGFEELLQLFGAKLKHKGRLLVSAPVEGSLYRFGRVIAGFGGKGDYHHRGGHEIFESIQRNRFEQVRRCGIPFNSVPFLYWIGEFRCVK